MNRLAQEPSLYLRQHAANPVHWQPWGPDAWQDAKRRNVPVLISIGYSSCHWCHVMEHQVFERADLALAMNQVLVCIKVDREERPDIDMVYMEAVQRMGLGGGWPLNVFCTPEGDPFYGGTYFPPANWAQVVREISRAWKESETDLRDTAGKFREVLQDRLPPKLQTDLEGANYQAILKKGLENLLAEADWVQGGLGQAPKFPLGGKYAFLLKTAALNPSAQEIALLTLRRMAEGGLQDHLAGGFFRYSTDGRWFAPHFEKMLYDNAQLLGTLSLAYSKQPDPIYKEAAMGILQWLKAEMIDPSGAFYGSIDADSEGEEGKFYTWPIDDWKQVLGYDNEAITAYWAITKNGNWEHGRNILARPLDTPLPAEWSSAKALLKTARDLRVPPTLDKKVLSGWNGLMISGLLEAYHAFDNQEALELADKNARYLAENLVKDNRLLHQPDQPTEGFLDDYGSVCLAFIHLYQATYQESWLAKAYDLAQRVIGGFADPAGPLFFYTSHDAEPLLARKKDVNDSVQPSGNAQMALVFNNLGICYENETFRTRAESMIATRQQVLQVGLGFSFGWGELALGLDSPEVAVVGPQATYWVRTLKTRFPQVVWAASKSEITLPIFAGKRVNEGETAAWVCRQGACLPPVFDVQKLAESLEAYL